MKFHPSDWDSVRRELHYCGLPWPHMGKRGWVGSGGQNTPEAETFTALLLQ